MVVHLDLASLNNAGSSDDWTTDAFDPPTLNDNSATTPLYIEGTADQFWSLKKGTTGGYTYTNTISGTPSLTGKVLVGWLNMSYADIANIPISAIALRVSSATTFTTNYGEWNAREQILAPKNTAISGHTPVMIYPTNPDGSNGTPNYGTIESVGWVATTGGTNDGKYGGFSWLFIIGWIGAHSATYTNTWLSSMASDATPATIPGTTSRPLGVFTRAGTGDLYRSNVSLRAGHGTSDTANTVISETGKAIYFDNLEPEQELGFDLVNPSGANTLSLTLVGCNVSWNSQPSTAEIVINPGNADTLKITGGSYSRGGQIPFPAASANKWVRGATFSGCQGGTASNGEFSDCTVENDNVGITVTGDADVKGTQFLTPGVAVNTSGLIWNGNFDPDGNLDGCVFSKGTAAHHAIVFGTATPTTMTLRDIDFSGFNASNAQNDSTLHIKRTSGTVTINLLNVTGNVSYRTDGATVVINNNVSVTFTDLIVGSEVRVYLTGTSTEVDGVESTAGTTFGFSIGSGVAVDYVILGPISGGTAYVPIRVENISFTADSTIKVSQQINRNFTP